MLNRERIATSLAGRPEMDEATYETAIRGDRVRARTAGDRMAERIPEGYSSSWSTCRSAHRISRALISLLNGHFLSTFEAGLSQTLRTICVRDGLYAGELVDRWPHEMTNWFIALFRSGVDLTDLLGTLRSAPQQLDPCGRGEVLVRPSPMTRG